MENKKTILIFFGVIFGILLSYASSGDAVDPDVRHIPPDVMLIIDSSASMEFLHEARTVPACYYDPLRDDSDKRTRWMMILDALLGPIGSDNFYCYRIYPGTNFSYYEYGIDGQLELSVPSDHIVPHFVALGKRDVTYGILEKYREFVRFGLSTFDSFEDGGHDEDGMWSYGRPDVYGRNLGIKMEEPISGGVQDDVIPGALVSWGSDSENINKINSLIRRELVQTIPYCGSPVAAALDDIEYFFLNDPDNKPPSQDGNDRYFDCRNRFAILITDGKPNAGEDSWYGKSTRQAADLWELNPRVPLYVIGFSICPGGTKEGDETRQILNDIANAGCPPSEPICPGGAYFVDDTYGLMDALDSILYKAVSDAATRTVALTTNHVGPHAAPGVVQYQFNTSFVARENAPWEGILERTSYACNSADEIELVDSEAEYVDYGDVLDARIAPRRIYTAINYLTKAPDTALDVFDVTNPDITPEVLGNPSGDNTWVADVVDFIHGRNSTARDPAVGGSRLADSFHASATILEPPARGLPFVSYYKYQADHQNRIPVIFLSTNEGIIHAFRVQDTGNATEKGEELWSYVPGMMLTRIAHQIPNSHIWGLDSTPTVSDVRLFKDADNDVTDEEWMAILVGGLRQGGNGYFALNVTDPLHPKFLWEITSDKSGFERLKETYATPTLGTVFTRHPSKSGNPLGEIAVVIFPGGFNPATRQATTSLYVVTADTGELIKELRPEFPDAYGCADPPDCIAQPECCAQLITNPVGYSAIPGYITSRVFVGDDRGRVWRADLSNRDPEQWHLTLFYPDPSPLPGEPSAPYIIGEPVENPVGLGIDEEGNLVVIYGTGNIDDLTSMTQNYVISLTEVIVYDSSASSYIGKAKFNWMIELQEGEKMLGQPVIFNRTAYFSTFIPYTNPDNLCDFGAGRIWGVYYNTDDPNKDGDNSDFARLDIDDVPDGEGNVVRYKEYVNTLIPGVTVVQRPSCLGIEDMVFNQSGGTTYELVAQASGTGGVRQGRRKTATINIKLPAPRFRNIADSWGTIIE